MAPGISGPAGKRVVLLEAAGFTYAEAGAPEHELRTRLARYLFPREAADRPFSALSGGERVRAALACVLAAPEPPQLLVLDEPTTHLDVDSMERLESTLAAYRGALVVISHDPDFLAGIGTERWLRLEAGRLEELPPPGHG